MVNARSKCQVPWELWCYCILMSCRVCSINPKPYTCGLGLQLFGPDYLEASGNPEAESGKQGGSRCNYTVSGSHCRNALGFGMQVCCNSGAGVQAAVAFQGPCGLFLLVQLSYSAILPSSSLLMCCMHWAE